MGREVRKVPADWQHPMEYNPYRGENVFKPLFDRSWKEAAAEWDAERTKWESGDRPDYASGCPADMPYDEYAGTRPFSGDYMPNWPEAERTHYMMYENTSEGTPISPAFVSPEELARWLADTGASSFGVQTASYEAWLRVAKGGYAPSAVITDGRMVSGVEAL